MSLPPLSKLCSSINGRSLTCIRTRWIYKNLDELIHATCFSDDADTFEQAAFDFVEFMIGSVCINFSRDRVATHLAYLTEYRPRSGRRCKYVPLITNYSLPSFVLACLVLGKGTPSDRKSKNSRDDECFYQCPLSTGQHFTCWIN